MVTIEKLAEEILNDLHNDLIDESIGLTKMRTCSKCHRQFDARLEYGESYYELAEMAMEYGTWYHNGCMWYCDIPTASIHLANRIADTAKKSSI